MATMTIDTAPLIGSQFPEEHDIPDWHNLVVATGRHGDNLDGNDQYVVLVAVHRTDKRYGTYSCMYRVYIAEHVYGPDDKPIPDKWKILYTSDDFKGIEDAVNGIKTTISPWATQKERNNPVSWIAGFTDCLER